MDAAQRRPEAAVGRARDLSIAALDETRDVAAQLRPPRINEIGLGAAIGDLAETAGIPVEVRFRASILPPSVIDPNRQIDAYRVIQEAVGNAARHSHAENVWIDAEITDGRIRLTVGDDGVGFDLWRGATAGLSDLPAEVLSCCAPITCPPGRCC